MSDQPRVEMSHERALEIVRAINSRAFLAMGLLDDRVGVPSLTDVALAQMMEAKVIVEAANERRREEGSGGYSINVVPDDRLIAAVYVAEHYRPSREAIVATTVDGRDQLVAVFYANAGDEEAGR